MKLYHEGRAYEHNTNCEVFGQPVHTCSLFTQDFCRLPVGAGCIALDKRNVHGPVVKSIISLTSSLVVKMFTVLVSTVSNSEVFLLKKCEKPLTFFSKNIRVYAIFNDQSFNDTLTKDIVSFKELVPGKYFLFYFIMKTYCRYHFYPKYWDTIILTILVLKFVNDCSTTR